MAAPTPSKGFRWMTCRAYLLLRVAVGTEGSGCWDTSVLILVTSHLALQPHMPLLSIYSLALEQDLEFGHGMVQAVGTLQTQTFMQVGCARGEVACWLGTPLSSSALTVCPCLP